MSKEIKAIICGVIISFTTTFAVIASYEVAISHLDPLEAALATIGIALVIIFGSILTYLVARL